MRPVVFCWFIGTVLWAGGTYAPPRFTDPQRILKLESAFPEVDGIFSRYLNARNIPGMVWGVVIDGRLAHVMAGGARNRASGDPVTPETVFRIASMTKSFTALAILKLRDDGRLSLDDPVSRWIAEFARMEMPTRDSPPIRIRHLLTHGAGFPEDNPWADQQLGVSNEQVNGWLKMGIPFATAPDTRYEYSNYGFGLLGRIVVRASGMTYDQYLRKEILEPLHMTSTTLDPSQVPPNRRAIGYRRQPDGSYLEEPPLPNGVFGAMGGLLTSAADMAKYIAFQLSAWPPRDDADPGPVRRGSVREMNRLWRLSNLTVSRPGGNLEAEARGYGYGLRVSADCRFEHIVGHAGGLPGFGSYMAWLPEYGVGMFAMANLTYVGPAQPISEAWNALARAGGLRKRELPALPILAETRDRILSLWRSWDSGEAKKMAAVNLFLDVPEPQMRREIERLKAEVGGCSAAGPVLPEDWLRGQFNLSCEKGTVGIFFALAPTQPPAVQYLSFQRITGAGQRLSAPTSPPTGVSCAE